MTHQKLEPSYRDATDATDATEKRKDEDRANEWDRLPETLSQVVNPEKWTPTAICLQTTSLWVSHELKVKGQGHFNEPPNDSSSARLASRVRDSLGDRALGRANAG